MIVGIGIDGTIDNPRAVATSDMTEDVPCDMRRE
jgi:hypothetical protein